MTDIQNEIASIHDTIRMIRGIPYDELIERKPQTAEYLKGMKGRLEARDVTELKQLIACLRKVDKRSHVVHVETKDGFGVPAKNGTATIEIAGKSVGVRVVEINRAHMVDYDGFNWCLRDYEGANLWLRRHVRFYCFTNPTDAMLFKLEHGGA